MSAGRVPHNPSELLGSQRMQQLLHELARDHLVVLDAPPLLPVTDAALLAAISDGAMVVFAIGTTYKEQARLAKRRLGQTGGRMLGVVLNRAPLKGLGAVVYGYGYGSYTSTYGDDAAPPRRARAPARRRPWRRAVAGASDAPLGDRPPGGAGRARPGGARPGRARPSGAPCHPCNGAPGASFDVPTATASQTADPSAEADLIQAPVLLGANESGLVLRATRGACEARFDNPAHFWAGNLDDADGLQRWRSRPCSRCWA